MKDSNNTFLPGQPHPDRESWAGPRDALDLRVWLRMLTCSTLIENHVRSRMRVDFGTTLPRFDLMAQLASAPRGMKMTDLSRCMMVTNGNVTGITDQLERDGMVERLKVDTDRRSCVIRLTAKGRQSFRRMSAAYRDSVGELFADLPADRLKLLHELLGEFKIAGMSAVSPETAAASR